MKKIIYFVLLAGFLAPFSLTSCQSINYSDELDQIDSLSTILDTIEHQLARIDIDHISSIRSKVVENLSAIQNVMVEYQDTMDKESAIFLSRYNTINKGLKKFDSNYSKLTGELKFSRNQLKTFANDLEGSKWPKDEAIVVLTKETQAVRACELALTDLKLGIEFAVEHFEENNAKVQEIVTSVTDSLQTPN